jgi:hypothetical protein
MPLYGVASGDLPNFMELADIGYISITYFMNCHEKNCIS